MMWVTRVPDILQLTGLIFWLVFFSFLAWKLAQVSARVLKAIRG